MSRTLFMPRLLRSAALAGLALAAPGCATQPTAVDPSYSMPEGMPNADARLILFPDLPTQVDIYDDRNPAGPSPNDVKLGSVLTRVGTPGTVHGVIMDRTPASGYQVLRREAGGGFRAIKDYVVVPKRRWLTSQYEAYTFRDTLNSGYTPPTYVGRGVVSGAVTPSSPLTNVADLATAPLASVVYTGTRFPADAQGKCDSLFLLTWNPVPGAAGYWLQVFEFREATTGDQILSSVPAPFYLDKSRDVFVGYVAAPTTQYRMGGPGALVLVQRQPICDRPYNVRVAAVDSGGRLIGFSFGDTATAASATTYARYALGAVIVQPKNR